MQFLTEYAYAATVSATFLYDCAPLYPVCNAVHDPLIAVKTLRVKRALGLFIGCNMVRRHRQLASITFSTYVAKNASSTLSAL